MGVHQGVARSHIDLYLHRIGILLLVCHQTRQLQALHRRIDYLVHHLYDGLSQDRCLHCRERVVVNSVKIDAFIAEKEWL